MDSPMDSWKGDHSWQKCLLLRGSILNRDVTLTISTNQQIVPQPVFHLEKWTRGGKIIGVSLSEPHIDEFAVNFLYIYIYISVVRRAVSRFLLLFCVCQTYICCTSCRKSLPALILCIPLASCVISKTTQATCGVQWRHEEQSHGWMDSAIGVPACWTYISCVEVTGPITSGYSDGG